MIPELLFYIVTKRKWKENNQKGWYKPDDFKDSGYIKLMSSSKIEKEANKNFSGRKKVLLLVIDTYRIAGKISKKSEDGYFILNGALNSDALLDKILLESNPDGKFEVDVELK